MSGTTDLHFLLKNATPRLNPGIYVFCTVTSLEGIPFDETVFTFREDEGLTVVLPQSTADDLKLDYEFPAAWITLNVVSSLEAVGLTSAFSTALAQRKISCNVVAGFYHDHLFVKSQDATRAMEVLVGLGSAPQN